MTMTDRMNLEGQQVTPTPGTSDQPTLECRGITKTYQSTDPPTHVLNGIDLQVRPGEFLVIMGASGSGKSTLLYSISGMDRPSSGTVLLEGGPLTSLSDTEMSRVRLTRMGFVFQQAYLLANLNIGDNILLPALKANPKDKAAATARVDALMERFDIAHVRTHGITQVSGGQLQRASICRALACEPAILFADEPTGALNSSMTIEVMDALSDVHAAGTTVVMVTHDPSCAARGDRVIYLRDGSLVNSRELGRWTAERAGQREDDLLAWLRHEGF
ncbi:putative ABC transporter ATP-binding protein [Microlunatus phosphovorus NM-1]|uniref:Putative ABC transporter ATP-binding protein n=1 Tax=Microlunatus phosphovorus (strain ATCC 700054 / DSM 10555 / JCM 9379 / NBRC 101784 / NCIMB 13414 / VKM Ac-1990 / NM-1) TaxID=1032480 RepID=F5XHX7_MICPN|nr:ABC transporter ATP-binding protein [Microlunatus phosphovorus]BAK33272.1 putative ABC transporter ATP-binding protein [Microlunatus phosphovorus NM-1]